MKKNQKINAMKISSYLLPLKKYFCLLLSCISFTLQSASMNDSLWQLASTQYKNGLYKEAAATYKTLIDQGYRSAALYYNMGNAMFRLKEYPAALLYYEKAKLYAPGDEEINYNLELTRTLTGDKIEGIEEFFLIRWIQKGIGIFSFEQWAWISVISFLVSMITLTGYLFARLRSLKVFSFWLCVLFFLLSIKSFFFASIQYHTIHDSRTAIVMSPVVTARSSPAATGSELFVIHEGTKVTLLQQSGEWIEIKLMDGSRGWIKASEIEKI